MFRLEMLPAKHGDALWLSYGDVAAPRHLLIDGGPRSRTTSELLAARIASAPELELVVVTHIDADHITGVLRVLEDDTISVTARDLWFNGWQHLPTDLLGAKQGEALGAAIRRRRLPWNEGFDEGAVMLADDGALPEIELPGGLLLTLLSPTRAELAALRPVWKAEVEKAGLVPGAAAQEVAAQPDLLGDERIDPDELAEEPFSEDGSEANGASIAMLAEYDGKALLLTGDGHGGVLTSGLRRLARQRGVERVPVDAFKLPHHGSKYNVSRDVIEMVDCPRFLFSTNGNIFHHPDPVAVSRIVVDRNDVSLEFNYRTEFTERWDSSRMKRRFKYTTVFPPDGTDGLVVEL